MGMRQFVFVGVVSSLFAIASPASATELREPRAHMVVDVPNAWAISTEGEWVKANPQDNSFQLRLMGNEHGAWGEAEAEQFMMTKLVNHMSNITVDTHGRHVDWNSYAGVEIFGHGITRAGYPGKWFALVLVDKRNPRKGVVALGTGSNEGFAAHHPGIYQALHTLRTY